MSKRSKATDFHAIVRRSLNKLLKSANIKGQIVEYDQYYDEATNDKGWDIRLSDGRIVRYVIGLKPVVIDKYNKE